jgi:soluble cytochrome b562
MSQEARINSVAVLRQLRASLNTFAEIAAVALDETSAGIQHTRQWLMEDRYRHWKTQVQARTDQYVQAKLTLKRKQIFDRALAGSPGSCIDEKKALRRAEERLQEAEHKFSRVKSWTLQIDKEMSDYRKGVQGLVQAVEVEIPNARAKLDKMIESLEAYLALAPPEMAAEMSEESVRLPIDDFGSRIGEPEPDPQSAIRNPKSKRRKSKHPKSDAKEAS